VNIEFDKIPPATHEQRPEKESLEETLTDRIFHTLKGKLIIPFIVRPSHMKKIINPVMREGDRIKKIDNGKLKEKIKALSLQLKKKGFTRQLIIKTFACIREAANRTIHMRHFEPQIAGGYALLNGIVAEMDTGEGKTLTATLAAGTAALAGIPVHVISVNDYLTQRDAGQMSPVYEFLGLSVGYVIHGMDQFQRRSAYACDITYCTNKEITFDYLKDKLVLNHRSGPLDICTGYLKDGGSDIDRLMMRGLSFAIVDEADSVLIDEARTPLVISQAIDNKEETQFYQEALDVAAKLEQNRDYTVLCKDRKTQLTDLGRIKAKKITTTMNPLWESSVRREEFITLGLNATLFFKKNEHYLVTDGKVLIIDEFTGRVMADRSWEKGLHQLIETKEKCALSGRKETLARMSYQKFFRRYLMLSGMTGTAREVKNELWSVYGLPIVKIPPHKKKIRKRLPDRIHRNTEDKWADVVDRVRFFHDQKRPVLIGTKSVAASEYLGALLQSQGLHIRILNARQDQEEAQIIAQAGEARKIMVATNMAGRGTDIKLTDDVIQLNGLHVILTQRHDAARIDKQLEGRCGRQGEPGSFEAIVCLEDDLVASKMDRMISNIIGKFNHISPRLFAFMGKLHLLRIQKSVERKHARIRKDVFKQDNKRNKLLSFSGQFE